MYMLKLIKHEFKKSAVSTIVLLSVAAGIFLLAPLGKLAGQEGLIVISMLLLLLFAYGAYIFVLVRGIAAYSRELKNRSCYMYMMAPVSAGSVLYSKLIFTCLTAILLLLVIGAAGVGAYFILFGAVDGLQYVVDLINEMMLSFNMSLASIAYMVLFAIGEILLSVLVMVAMGYLSVTLSTTIMRRSKLRGLVSFALYAALFALMIWLNNAMAPGMEAYETPLTLVNAMLPSLGVTLAMVVGYTSLSAWLLREKISL